MTINVKDVLLPESRDIEIGELSDGYHTYNELYRHRMGLFLCLAMSNKDLAWKSLKHEDGTMYDGYFIVGIKTREGQATYHCDKNEWWNLFDVKELPYAPAFDGHTPEVALERLMKEFAWSKR